MGTYLIIPKNKERKSKLKAWFDKWKPFCNDFGQEHTSADIFGDKLSNGDIRFKIGVMERRFYPEKVIDEIKEIIVNFGGDPKEE